MTQTRVSVQRATLKNYGDIILCNLNIKTDIISGKIYIYDDKLGFYNSENSLAILEREIIDLLDNEYTKNKVEQIVKYIKVKTQEDLKKNNKVNLVCLNNGIFDLNEGKLIEKNKEDFVSLRLNVKWEPNSSLNNCRYWNEYIESTVHPQDINKLQEGLGNIFEPSYITKKIFYLYGGPNSGKTTFILIIQDFLGKNNYTALDLKDIEQESYEIAELYEKRANFGPEIPYKLGFKNINIIKKLTGGDEFTARRIYDSPFKFNNVAKVFFSGNEIPRVYATDCDYAFFDRWEFIDFHFILRKIMNLYLRILVQKSNR
jgi:phage/plasmid-associated DNA primase